MSEKDSVVETGRLQGRSSMGDVNRRLPELWLRVEGPNLVLTST